MFMKFIKKYQNFVPITAFLVLIIIGYVNVFHAPFLIDDKDGIVNNKQIGNFGALLSNPRLFIAYFPYYLSFKLGGLTPFYYRFFNILFHFGNTVMLYLIVKRLINFRTAVLTSLIFSVHPLLTESVTWISALSYPQYSFFYLLSIFCYLLGKDDKKWYIASIISAGFAILSAEKAVTLPVVLLAVELAFFSLKDNWKRIVPHFIVVIGFATFYLLNIGSRVAAFQKDYYIKSQYYNPIEHVPYAVTYYIQLFLAPINLTIYHSELSITAWEFLIRWLFFIILIVSIVISFSKSKNLFFWLTFFLLALAPTMIPLNIVWVVAERYAYLSVAGLSVVLGILFNYLLKKKLLKTATYAVFTVVVITLIGLTILRNVDWQSAENLWTSALIASPHSSNAHNNMGDIYAQRNDYVSAARSFKRATELQAGDADPRHNLGIALTILGRYEEAVDAYLGALQIEPTLYKTNQNLGVVYYTLKRYPEAEEYLSKAIKYGPPNPSIEKLLKQVRSLQGK